MTRETQNILMGALACGVAAVAMIAVSLVLLGGDDDPTVAGVDPLSGQAVEAGDAEAVGADGTPLVPLANQDAGASTRSTLAVALSGDTITTSSTVPASSSTTAAPTTAPTTAATAAPTTATTAAPTTAETTASTAPDTSAGSSTETSDGTSTSTEMTTSTPSSTDQPTSTVGDGSSTTAAPAPGGGMNDIEREIARLTNELRTNPNGALKRQGPVINCGGRIRVDNAGGYESIGALTVHEAASLQVARPWSAQMTRNNFDHQPSAGVGALQSIGISVRSAGENIAYHNYSDKAMNHFTGWRESDGHFCNMMDPGFTHIGVGEVTKDDGISYATQNFFSLR